MATASTSAPPPSPPIDDPAAHAIRDASAHAVDVPATHSIAGAARETGLSPDALRYYEREGLLLQPVDRASSSHRRYRAEDLYWIRLVTKLRGTGMPIRAVREYAALVRAGEGNEAERLALLEDHRTRVLRQLEETRENLRAIEHKIDVYRGRAPGRTAERTPTP